MIKQISISGKQFVMDNSMWSHKIYVEQFGSDMFKDISNVRQVILNNKDKIDLAISSDLLDVALKVAYAMIVNHDEEKAISWKDFNKQIDNIQENQGWVLEVFGFATMFQGKTKES